VPAPPGLSLLAVTLVSFTTSLPVSVPAGRRLVAPRTRGLVTASGRFVPTGRYMHRAGRALWARCRPAAIYLGLRTAASCKSLHPGRILAASVAKNYISKLLGTWYHSPCPTIKARTRLRPASCFH
jgi:hypothetical protein